MGQTADSDPDSRELAGLIRLETAAQISRVVLGMAAGLLTAALLGPSGYGILVLACLVPQTVATIVGSGTSAMTMRSVAGGLWKDSEACARIYGLAMLLTTVSLGTGLLLWPWRGALVPGVPESSLLVASSLIPTLLLEQGLGALLRGKLEYRRLMVVGLIRAVAVLALTIIVVGYLRCGVTGALSVQVASALVGVVLSIHAVMRALPASGVLSFPNLVWHDFRRDFAFGGYSSAANAATYLTYRSDQFLLNCFLGSAEVGVYSVAVSMVEKLWLLVGGASSIVFAISSDPNKERAKVGVFAAKYAAISFWALVLASLCLLCLVAALIGWVLPQDYLKAVPLARWLLPGVVCLGVAKVLSSYIAGRGWPEFNAWCSCGVLLLNVVLNLLTVPVWGATAAAISTTICYSLATLICLAAFRALSGVPVRTLLVPDLQTIFSIIGRVRRTSRPSVSPGSK